MFIFKSGKENRSAWAELFMFIHSAADLSQVWHSFALLQPSIHPSLALSLILFYHHILAFLPHGEVKHCDSAVFCSYTQVWAVAESLHIQMRVVTSFQASLQKQLKALLKDC